MRSTLRNTSLGLTLLLAALLSARAQTITGTGNVPTCSGGQFVNGPGSCGTPAGGGNVTGSGSTTSGNLLQSNNTGATLDTATDTGIATSAVTTLTGTQTLSNKTLTSPIINGATFSGSLAGTANFTGTFEIGGKALALGAALTTTGTSVTTLAFPSSGTPTYTFPSTSKTIMASDLSNASGWPTSGDLMLAPASGAPTAYGGATCTNQVLTALSAAGAGTCASVTSAYISGTITAAQMLGLATGDVYQGNGSSQPAAVTLSAAIDAGVGSTRGSILERGSSGWALITPGTTGYCFTSNGSGTDPSYQACAGGGSTTITLGTGLTNTSGTQNTGGQTVTNGSSLYPQDWPNIYTSGSPHTVALSDGVQLYGAGAGSAYTFDLASATGGGSGATGVGYCFFDSTGNGVTLSSAGGNFIGSVPSGTTTTLTLPAGSYPYVCPVSDGTNWDTGVAFGVQPVTYGGTGQTSYVDGQLLIGNSSTSSLSKATITAGAGISVTNGHGSITIANTVGATFNVVSKTSNYNVASADDAARFDNAAASGSVIFTLPTSPSAGDNWCFLVAAAQTVEVLANTGETITLGGTQSASAGNIQSGTIGNSVCLYFRSATTAYVENATGSWQVN